MMFSGSIRDSDQQNKYMDGSGHSGHLSSLANNHEADSLSLVDLTWLCNLPLPERTLKTSLQQ